MRIGSIAAANLTDARRSKAGATIDDVRLGRGKAKETTTGRASKAAIDGVVLTIFVRRSRHAQVKAGLERDAGGHRLCVRAFLAFITQLRQLLSPAMEGE
jgi:hypothetical protein